MSKHTPGPWTVGTGKTKELKGEILCVGLETTPDWTPISIISPVDAVTETDLANARLIAAAPDLLAALNAMLTHMGMDEDEWNKPTFNQARVAVAKATGAAA